MMYENNKITIKQWHEDDRPREKLLSKGKSSLSTAELIAILIGSGNTEESAVALSKRILASVDNNLQQLGKLSINQLTAFKGIGQAKAVSIVAALELGKRRGMEESAPKTKISSSKHVFDLMQPLIGDLPHEEFWVLYLNNSNKVIDKKQLSKGGITSTVVDNRLIFKTAFEVNAVSIILAHNHPSGSLNPSEHDQKITQTLREAARQLEISLLDHLIITEFSYFSFADEGVL